MAISGDREIALNQSMELSIEEESATLLVVPEEILGAQPESMGGLLGFHNDVEDVIRDEAVEPSEDGKVLLCPIGVGGVGVGVVDVSEQTKLVKYDGEEGTSSGVV